MAEQPTNMNEMVASLMRVVINNPDAVIATITTNDYARLSTAQRTAHSSYMLLAQAAEMGLANAAPGSTQVTRQTDWWHQTHDQNGNFGRLSGLVQIVGNRIR